MFGDQRTSCGSHKTDICITLHNASTCNRLEPTDAVTWVGTVWEGVMGTQRRRRYGNSEEATKGEQKGQVSLPTSNSTAYPGASSNTEGIIPKGGCSTKPVVATALKKERKKGRRSHSALWKNCKLQHSHSRLCQMSILLSEDSKDPPRTPGPVCGGHCICL